MTTYTLNNASSVLFTNSNIVPGLLAVPGSGNVIIYQNSNNSYTLNLDNKFVATGYGLQTKEELLNVLEIAKKYNYDISYLKQNISYLIKKYNTNTYTSGSDILYFNENLWEVYTEPKL